MLRTGQRTAQTESPALRGLTRLLVVGGGAGQGIPATNEYGIQKCPRVVHAQEKGTERGGWGRGWNDIPDAQLGEVTPGQDLEELRGQLHNDRG